MTAVRDQLFPQKPPGSRFRFSRTGVQPSPGSSTIELPSAFAESGAYLFVTTYRIGNHVYYWVWFEARSVNNVKNTTTTSCHVIPLFADSEISTFRRFTETAQVRDVRSIGEGRGLRGGPGKRVDGVFPGRSQSFRHQRRPVDDWSPGRGGMA